MKRLVVLALVLALPTMAEARRILGVGAHVGYAKAADADDGTEVFGGDLSLRPLSVVGALLEVGYREDDVEVDDPTGTLRGVDLETIPVLLSAQVFPWGEELGPFSPFAIGGVGWYVTRAEVKARVGGLDLNLGDHLTLTGDLRYVFLETDLEDVDDADADGVRLTAGVKFFF